MIKVEHLETYGWEAALRGVRNPMNSWAKSDTVFDEKGNPTFGPNDLDLMKRLFKAGTEHRKYLRQIGVSFDMTAPLYMLKEFDTYKVGTTANSCSTMHTIHKKEFEMDDFSHEHLDEVCLGWLRDTINLLNCYRRDFIDTREKEYWWQLIQTLPSSYNQKRTFTMNYEVVFNILRQRSAHKLDEWKELCGILRTLPLVKELEDSLCE